MPVCRKNNTVKPDHFSNQGGLYFFAIRLCSLICGDRCLVNLERLMAECCVK